MKMSTLDEGISTQNITKNRMVQLFCAFRSRNIKLPNTTRIARSGIIALIPSAFPRLLSSVISVNQALKAASFAVEPKNVIRQSSAMVNEIPRTAAGTVEGTFVRMSSRRNAKEQTEIPHNTYPETMKIFRFAILSESVPIRRVVRAAVTAEVVTMTDMSAVEAWNIR